MSETVHHLIGEAKLRHERQPVSEVRKPLADYVLAVFREHGIKLCRDQVGGYDPSDHEINRRWMGKGMGHMVPAFVPLTDEEIGQ